MAAGNGEQTTSQQGFWKPRHAAIGVGVLLLVIFAVRSCGGDTDEETVDISESGENIPRQAIVVQIPATQPQRPVQVAPGGQQFYQPPVYVQPQPALPTADPGNPWAVRQQPAYSYEKRSAPQQSQAPGWGRQQPQRPQYAQPPGASQYRPLEEKPRQARERRSVVPTVPVPVRPAAPYDRRSGSSFGANGANPYGGAYPGYYGAAPYVGPGGYGGHRPGGYGYPGTVAPGAW
jgi:hypothetical protein